MVGRNPSSGTVDDEVPVIASMPRRKLGEGSIVADRYRIERVLALGGMATVYLAQDQHLKRTVALKVLTALHGEVATRGHFQERFKLEAMTLASFAHPNIVTVHDYGPIETDGFFMAMEYVKGRQFSELLKRGALPVERGLRLILQVCSALHYTHSRGVIHRDIKLSNILVTQEEGEEEQIKLVDFGLVKMPEADQKLTSVGMVMGSPHFMAPEQVKGLPMDHRVDIYAVGVLLYYSFTGKAPFHGPTPMGTMTAHVIESVPTFAVIIPDIHISPKLETVVQRCLAKLPEDRYPDMAALMADLIACFEEDTGFAYGPSLANIKSIIAARELPPPQARRLPRSLLIGGLLMAGVSIGIGVGLWNSGRLSEAEVAMPVGVPALQPTSSAALDPPASGSPGGTTGAGKVFDVASPSGASGAENRSNGVAEKGAGAEPIPAASPSAVAADVNPAEASSPTTPTVREIQETVRVTTNSLAIKLEPTSRDSAPVAMTTMKASPKVSRPASNAPTTRTSATVRSEKSTRTAPVQASSASEDVVREEGRATADRSAPADEPAAATHDRTGAATPGPANPARSVNDLRDPWEVR